MPNSLQNVDKDLIYCPISLQIIRHPVLASDGYHYELKELSQWLRDYSGRSPKDRSTITFFKYDYALKASLDASYGNSPDRYEQYDNFIESQKMPSTCETFWNHRFTKSFVTFLCSAVTLSLIYSKVHEGSHDDSDAEHRQSDMNHVAPVALCISMMDLAIRTINNNRFGLFSPSIITAPRYISKYINSIRESIRENYQHAVSEEENAAHRMV